MKHSRFWVFLFLAGIFMLSNGCVRYYKTSDIRRSLNSARAKTRRLVSDAQGALKSSKAAMGKLKGRMPALPDATENRLRSLLAESEQYLEPLKNGLKEVETLVKRFAMIAKSHKTIRADRPEWDKVKKIRQRLDFVRTRLNDAVDNFNRTLVKFKEAFNQVTSG